MFAHSVFPSCVFFGGVFPPAVGAPAPPPPRPSGGGGGGGGGGAGGNLPWGRAQNWTPTRHAGALRKPWDKEPEKKSRAHHVEDEPGPSDEELAAIVFMLDGD